MTNIAKKLHKYMQFRAVEENKNYDLTPEFFQELIGVGIEIFFGIHVDEYGLISDDQNPSALDKWKKLM